MILLYLDEDGKVVHVGSINGSETSSKANREMALQVQSEALYASLHAIFDDDWDHEPPLGHVLIREMMYRPSDSRQSGEWIEIYSPTSEPADLSRWYLGDIGPAGEFGSGLHQFPQGTVLPAGSVVVIAQPQAADIGFTPDFEFLVEPNRDDLAVANMVHAGS
jgi:hypothetical protein